MNASEDDKICELLANGGYEMLGYYWRFVEYLYNRGGRIYKSKLKSIAWSLHMDFTKLNELVKNYDLFCEDEDFIYSKRILAEVEEFEAVGRRMAEIGRLGGKASAKAKGQVYAQADAQTHAKADAQQNKIKENKIKKIKENKKESSALSGNLPDGYQRHENSGELYKVVDGKMYNPNGDELNSEGFVKIDFKLSKSSMDF
jgi:hypothetical protein